MSRVKYIILAVFFVCTLFGNEDEWHHGSGMELGTNYCVERW
jgi:hypothetical protein